MRVLILVSLLLISIVIFIADDVKKLEDKPEPYYKAYNMGVSNELRIFKNGIICMTYRRDGISCDFSGYKK